VAGSLQSVRGVRAVLVLVLASGCFYTDPIDQRPSVAIEQLSSAQVFHGDVVNLEAVADDPDGDAVALQWREYACSDATPAPDGSRPGCDDAPLSSAVTSLFSFDAPTYRADGATPVGAVYVTLDATDRYGATARPGGDLIIAVADVPPSLALSKQARPSYVVDIPVPLFAKVGDADDGPAAVDVAWTAFSPSGSESLATESTAQPDPDHLQLATTLVPAALGEWTVQVTATDPTARACADSSCGGATTQSLVIEVGPDEPPCLGTWTPAAAPAGDVLPISAPTLFQVLVVADDLDPFPADPSDPELGTTAFAWSLLPPGGATREPLSTVTGAAVALDPASYQPGDIAELRVEIFDRNHTPIPCADADATCSIGADACLQRLTWRVEMQ